MPVIRLATLNDEKMIREVHRQSHKQIGSFNLFYVWDKYISGKANYVYYVCDDSGFVRVGYSEKHRANVVYEIGVLQSMRGRGIAKNMIMSIGRPVMLKCFVDNKNANDFYKSIGMQLAGKTVTRNTKKEMNVWVLL